MITYKKKTTNKSQKECREDDESDSVPSLKSGVFSDDSVNLSSIDRFDFIKK